MFVYERAPETIVGDNGVREATIHDYVESGRYAKFIESLYGADTTISEYHALLNEKHAKSSTDESPMQKKIKPVEIEGSTSLGSLEAIRAASYMWWDYDVNGEHPYRNNPIFKNEQRRRCEIWHLDQEKKKRKSSKKA